MHILIAILTAAAGLIWALYRLQNSGVDLNSFNPFYWMRRRRWEKQLETKPLYKIESSMECAAVLVVAMAELDGIVTREHKNEVIDLFTSEFGINNKTAAEMYASSSHLLKEATNITNEIKNILAPTKAQFEDRHVDSLLMMLTRVSLAESEPSDKQNALIETVKNELRLDKTQPQKWQ